MICPYCGKENVDRSPFCADCGKSLAGTYDITIDDVVIVPDSSNAQSSAQEAAQASTQTTASTTQTQPEASAAQATSISDAQPEATTQAASTPAPQAQPAAEQTASQSAAAQPQPQPTAATQAQSTPQAQPQPQPAPQPVYQQATPQPQSQPVKPVYAQGCLGAAWKDITSTPGWFKKILLLGLIMCVPILNFYVFGYCMRWARQLVLGKIEPMPQKIFEEGNFSQGFYMWVWTIVLSLVCSVATSIASWVPFLGIIVVICIALFEWMFSTMGIMRLAISKSLGRAFDISEDWRGFTKSFGSLFCATVLPYLVLFVGVFIFALLLTPAAFAAVGSPAFNSVAMYSTGDAMSVLTAMLIFMIMMLPAFLIGLVVMMIFEAFVYVWSLRAVGHYVARELPEWKSIAPQNEQ